MILRFSRLCLTVGVLFLSNAAANGLEVTAVGTNAESFDLTGFAEWVHFTATSTSASADDVTLNGSGIPNVSVRSGTAFTNFNSSFVFNANVGGAITGADNPYAVDVVYQEGPTASNSRNWRGDWNSSEGVDFEIAVPTANGSLLLFVAGFNDQAAGQASLAASFGGGNPQNDDLTFTNPNYNVSEPDTNYWGARFEVSWTGRTVGDVLSLNFANIPVATGGYSGPIAVVVPEPSTYALALVAAMVLAGAKQRRTIR